MVEAPLTIAHSELILGGQKSGKSRRAELLARAWLARSPQHRAALIATGQPWDDEMRVRIVRHQDDRRARVPGLLTIEEPLWLTEAIARHSSPQRLLVVDCLTLWLTNLMMPAEGPALGAAEVEARVSSLTQTLRVATGPVVLVGNEIGLGVIPLGREVRAFVDTLGRLNQAMASACARVTLVAAGLPLTLKDER